MLWVSLHSYWCFQRVSPSKLQLEGILVNCSITADESVLIRLGPNTCTST